MLVMQSTNIPFQELANKIARDFLVKGASLEDGIVNEAKKRDLKPEEVKRLVEKSNTAASILYLKNSEDKKGSFDLAKKEDVLKRTHPTADDSLSLEEIAEDATEAAVAENTGLPETRKVASYDGFVLSSIEKQASANEEITVHDIFAARDRLAELRQLKFAAEIRLQDILHDIISEYQYKTSDDLSKLASDASDLYGKNAMVILDSASEYLRMPIDLQKFASDIIDDTAKPMQLLKGACEILEALPKMQDVISSLDEALAKVGA